ncbi:uncharacterized protein LOC128012022 isoform X4 [Carassius gibelio]|uniref:uncharacterized protein LOC128012022 isoform X4 n=1 Tax=Carassius gibelio TaxID=101364 RepID=UPI002279CA80|nr:uncharacterized protein LOC128012022 isoform X4 [Carassius gibelio]
MRRQTPEVVIKALVVAQMRFPRALSCFMLWSAVNACPTPSQDANITSDALQLLDQGRCLFRSILPSDTAVQLHSVQSWQFRRLILGATLCSAEEPHTGQSEGTQNSDVLLLHAAASAAPHLSEDSLRCPVGIRGQHGNGPFAGLPWRLDVSRGSTHHAAGDASGASLH